MTSRDPLQQQPCPQYDDDEISLLDLLLVLVRKKKLIFFTTLFFALGALAFSMLRTPPTPPRAESPGSDGKVFSASVRFLPPVPQTLVLSGADMRSTELPAFSALSLLPRMDAAVWNSVLKGPKIGERLRRRFSPETPPHAAPEEGAPQTGADGQESFSPAAVSIQPEKEGGALRLTVEHSDRVKAAVIANAYVEELEHELTEMLLADASVLRGQLTAELESVRKRLAAAEATIQAYRESNGELSLRAHEDRFSTFPPESAAFLQEAPENFEYAGLLREWRFLRDLYSVVQWNHEAARMNEEHARVEIPVLEAAAPEAAEPAVSANAGTPPAPQSRRSFVVVLGAFLGFFLSIFLAFIAEFWKKASEDPEQSEKVRELRESLGISKLFTRKKKPPKKR